MAQPVSGIGQVPPLQDRQHREYLKRLSGVVERLKPSIDAAGAANAAALNRLRGELAEIRERLAEVEDGDPVAVGSGIQDDFVADAEMLAAKQVTLSAAPADPFKVELSIYGGIEQRPGVDFVVDGQSLSWDGLALELLLEIGTAFSVRY